MSVAMHVTGLADRAPARSLIEHVPTIGLLGLGALMMSLAGTRWGVGFFGWVAPVPFLLAARRWRSRRDVAVMLGVLGLAAALHMAKVVTPPVPWLIIAPYAIPIALRAGSAFALTEFVRRRRGEGAAIGFFAAFMAVTDYVVYRHTEFGAWLTTANSQVDALEVLQLASLFGLPGIGFLMSWTAAVMAMALGAPATKGRGRHLTAVGLALAAVLVYGSIRVYGTQTGSVPVAGVVTDQGLDDHGQAPSAEAMSREVDALFARTELAAERGARLVVWNEVATLVTPAAERALLDRGLAVARQRQIDLVLGYGVQVNKPGQPLLMDNKYAFLTSDGRIAQTYRKHHPVPGEPSLRGEEPLQVLPRPYARVAGAICYDYDFPQLAREHARQGAELVVVPSSDWRGIDHVHTLMQRVRAIEGGFALLRPVRWGTSAGFDAYGRVRGWLPARERHEQLLVTTLPVERIATLYTRIGDAPVLLAAAYGLLLLLAAGRRRVREA